MRQFNERAVLQAIRLNGSLSQEENGHVTGLKPQTVSLILARLDRAVPPGTRRSTYDAP